MHAQVASNWRGVTHDWLHWRHCLMSSVSCRRCSSSSNYCWCPVQVNCASLSQCRCSFSWYCHN